MEAWLGDAVAASVKGLEAGFQFGEGEGFDQVVVGSGGEAAHAFLDGIAGGEEEDGGGVAAGAEAAENGETIRFRDHDVEDDDVVRMFREEEPCLLPIRGRVGGVAGSGEGGDESLPQSGGIFDNEEPHGMNQSSVSGVVESTVPLGETVMRKSPAPSLSSSAR